MSRPHDPEMEGRILDKALAELVERGIAAFSMRSLASRLGLTPTAIYHYFRNKSELLEAVKRRLLEDLDASVASAVAAVGAGPEERLAAVCRAMMAWFFAHPGEADLVMAELPARPDAPPEVFELYYRTFNRARDILREGIAERVFIPVDPELVASLGSALLWGTYRHARTMRVSPAYFGKDAELVEGAIDLLLRAYRASEKGSGRKTDR
jgi:AcrR family transcriptional regulator